ncbi:PaaI family thioesterase [Blastococcus deserti]|uniref:PaaI family thioesterase n=1 Tax=Blastococcus deserti TaxID=2259033 RepID=A0ABW4XF22_9ACTN
MSDDGAGSVAAGGFAERLGARAEVADDGSARMSFTAREEHLNQAGTLHGGVLATLVDTAMGTAVRSTVDDGDVPATSQLTVTYLRPGKPGELTVTARVRTRGEHLTVTEADVEQEGRSLAHAVATFALLHR